ncbi:MAG: hypothetical protein ACI4OP_03925 [Candidatus Coprovivens sp.]
MAAIDKIYITSIEQYREYKRWCDSIPYQHDSIDNLWHPSEFIYSRTEREYILGLRYNKEISLCNNPVYVDVFLIRNCPIEFIQNRLKEQYGDEYNCILNYTSMYDTYKPIISTKFKIREKPSFNFKSDNYWTVEINSMDAYWRYNSEKHCWKSNLDLCYCDSSCAYFKNMSLRKIKRLIKRWKLPIGVTITISGRYIGQNYTIVTC